jgi:hypothetical protein
LAVKDLEEPLSLDLITKLHSTLVKDVLVGEPPGELRDENSQYDLIKEEKEWKSPTVSKEGLIELFEEIGDSSPAHGASVMIFSKTLTMITSQSILKGQEEIERNKQSLDEIIEIALAPGAKISYIPPVFADVKSRMNNLINEYNSSIKKAETLDEKLSIIVKYIAGFERLHPFNDANIRTFVIVLLNRLLIQNGFPPATFYQPNVFDGFSHSQLIDKVRDAMEVTKKIVQGDKNIFGFNSDNIPTKYSKDYEEITADFIKTMAQKTKDAKMSETTPESGFRRG